MLIYYCLFVPFWLILFIFNVILLANNIIARIVLFNVIYARILLANIMYTCIFANNYHANILLANIICAKLQYWLVLFMYYWLI